MRNRLEMNEIKMKTREKATENVSRLETQTKQVPTLDFYQLIKMLHQLLLNKMVISHAFFKMFGKQFQGWSLTYLDTSFVYVAFNHCDNYSERFQRHVKLTVRK